MRTIAIRMFLVSLSLFSVVTACSAAEWSALQPLMVIPDKVVLQETFSKSGLEISETRNKRNVRVHGETQQAQTLEGQGSRKTRLSKKLVLLLKRCVVAESTYFSTITTQFVVPNRGKYRQLPLPRRSSGN